jgi:hypothetical protein
MLQLNVAMEYRSISYCLLNSITLNKHVVLVALLSTPVEFCDVLALQLAIRIYSFQTLPSRSKTH